jgi:hypothetical protein
MDTSAIGYYTCGALVAPVSSNGSKIEHDLDSIASVGAHLECVLDVLLREFVPVCDERFHVHSSASDQVQAQRIRVAVTKHTQYVHFPAHPKRKAITVLSRNLNEVQSWWATNLEIAAVMGSVMSVSRMSTTHTRPPDRVTSKHVFKLFVDPTQSHDTSTAPLIFFRISSISFPMSCNNHIHMLNDVLQSSVAKICD